MNETKGQNLNDYHFRGTIKQEVYLALETLENASDMELSKYVGRERNYITRARTDLIEEGLVKQSINRYCKVTGKYVQTWETGAETIKNNVLSDTQMGKVRKLITQMNDFQRKRVIEWLENL